MTASSAKADHRVAIVGAGPQGLATAVYLVAAGVDPDDLVVFDPAGSWLATWRRRFGMLGIAHLRSPAVHHPHPDPYALAEFARVERRTDELHHRYGLPSTSLYDNFCDQVITQSGLGSTPQAVRVVDVGADGVVVTDDGRVCRAAHVIWATDPSTPHRPMRDAPGGEEGADGTTCGEDAVWWEDLDDHQLCERRLVIVGGGLTAAHLVERALDAGSNVTWVTRRDVVERDFDTDPGWLGPREMLAFTGIRDARQRLQRVLDARGGGSVPSWIAARLEAAEREGRLRHVCGEVRLPSPPTGRRRRRSTELCVGAARVRCDAVILATGTTPHLAGAPALDGLARRLGTARVGGRPVLDATLRLPGSNVHVLGRLAQLSLGPIAGNLAGARRGAEQVVGAVVGLHAMHALVDA